MPIVERLRSSGNVMAGFQITAERICKLILIVSVLSVEGNAARPAVANPKDPHLPKNRMDTVVYSAPTDKMFGKRLNANLSSRLVNNKAEEVPWQRPTGLYVYNDDA